MAGAVKHMQRSHRSVSQRNTSMFHAFHRHAYTVEAYKQQIETIGPRLKRFVQRATSK